MHVFIGLFLCFVVNKITRKLLDIQFCSEIFTVGQYSDWLEVLLFVKIVSLVTSQKIPSPLMDFEPNFGCQPPVHQALVSP